MRIDIPEKVNIILNLLSKNGFEAFVVGGCVRDSILGLTPNDWDICTNAKPDKVQEIFKSYNIFDNGIKHGTLSVVLENEVFEITTYRVDGEYIDNRHPNSVVFTDDIVKDLSRRDFTINAIAYNEKVGIVDPFNGQEDLSNNLIRCVGNPCTRFNEDALRIIRAIRFASTFSFNIDTNTSDAIHQNANLLSNIAVERITVELNKLLCGVSVDFILNEYRDVIAVLIPEVERMFDYDQHTKHHSRDLYHHTTYAVKSVENTPLLRMTMLLHDLGKPKACKQDQDGVMHFKCHPKYSGEIAEPILRRLKYPTEFISTCITLIKFHDVRFTGAKRQMRHVMNKIGEENVRLLLKVQKADILAQSDYLREKKLSTLKLANETFNTILSEKDCFTLKQLNINGKDLISLGIAEGKVIGKILNRLLYMVIEDKIENDYNCLSKMAVKIYKDLGENIE